MAAPSSNHFVGRYQILKPLGQGGMGAVFLARDTKTQRNVALKILSNQPVTSEEYRIRFRQEAKALAKLFHPNIVGIVDYDEIRGRPCMVLEWVGGGTLANRMGKPMPYQEAASLLLPIAKALQYAHEQGVIHRDVKPSNILLTENGEPRLTDFGIAKDVEKPAAPNLTMPGTGMGTPEYMAPEQALGKPVDVRVDVYSLGVILFELVTGRKPYIADTPLGTMIQHSVEPLPRARDLVPDLPEEIDRVLYKALAKNPTERYQTMAEFAAVLEKLTAGKKLSARDAPPLPKDTERTVFRPVADAAKPTLPRWVIPAGIGSVVVIALLVVVIALLQRKDASGSSNQLALINKVQGDVQVIDGGSSSTARQGALVASSSQLLLRTNNGYAWLQIQNDVTVVVDSHTTLEFGEVTAKPAGATPRFNLLSGRALVINTKAAKTPFSALLGGEVLVSISQAAMGLEVRPGEASPNQVDCILGGCQVWAAGQTTDLAQMQQTGGGGPGQPLDGARYNAWAQLSGGLIPALQATATPSLAPFTATFTLAPSFTPTFTLTPTITWTPSATFTGTPIITATFTPSATWTSTRIPPTAVVTKTPTKEPPKPTKVPPTPTNPPPPATATNPPPPPPTDTPYPTYTPPPAGVPGI